MPRGSYYFLASMIILMLYFCWRRLFISQALDDIIEDINDNHNKITDFKQQCPECDSDWIVHDYKRMETICHACGLVTSGPPGYVAGRIQIQYPVQYNFFAEALGKGHNTKHGYYRAYYYFPEYTNDLY